MKTVRWEYNDTRIGSRGEMICGKCSGKITECRYRSRMREKRGEWGYTSQHEECSKEDPEWVRIDESKAQHQAAYQQFVAACVEFNEKWGRHLSGELDDYLPETRT